MATKMLATMFIQKTRDIDYNIKYAKLRRDRFMDQFW